MTKNHYRTIRRQARGTRRKILKKMRRDLIYMLKPRPRFLPNFIWLRRLKRLLILKPDQLKILKDL